MTDLRIVDAPILLQESITDDVKMPTGGLGNYAIRLGDIVWYVVAKEQLASKNYVDLSSKGVKDSLDEHIADKANPHQVTKAQVGLGNVDNTADIDKSVSNATKSAIITATNDMATKTYVNSKDGDLTTLKTADKTNLVKAVNEIHDVTEGVVALYDKNVEVGAGANGWTDLLVNNAESKPIRTVNIEQVDKVADLETLTKLDKRTVIVKSYHTPNYALANPFKGGGTFIYDSTKANVNDGGTCINGWVRQITQAEILATWFGAKGDGTTDDADAIQKAVNACNALNKPLRIPKGEGLGLYRITKPISITKSISISGDGYNYSGLKCDGCDGFAIDKAINHVSIIDMTILQATRYSITANNFAAIKINGTSDNNNFWCSFSNLFVDGFGYVVKGSYFWSTLFNNVISVYCGNGIYATGKSVNNFVNNCQLGGSSEAWTTGILLDGGDTASEGWVITNNLIVSFEEAITGYATSHVTVSNNILDFCVKRGVSMLDGANGASLNWTVVDNYIATENPNAATAIYSLNNQTASSNQNRGHNIKGNDIVAYSGARFTYGIRTEGTAEQNTLIDGNRVDTKGVADCSINGNAKNTVATNNRWLSGGFYNNTSSYIVYDNNIGAVTSSAHHLVQKRGKTTVYQGSTAPTSGNYVVGDIMWNTAPAIGKPVGWIYALDNSWKPFGMIS